MNTLRPGESLSIWQDTQEMSRQATLQENTHVDICVVGGGIAGLTTAYLLLKEGKSVCLLESFELCSGQTGKTTAHFSTAPPPSCFQPRLSTEVSSGAGTSKD